MLFLLYDTQNECFRSRKGNCNLVCCSIAVRCAGGTLNLHYGKWSLHSTCEILATVSRSNHESDRKGSRQLVESGEFESGFFKATFVLVL